MATRTKGTKPLAVTTVVVKTLNRQTQDIKTWRDALKSADNGRRKRLYDLYEDILLDNFLSDAIDKRVRAITNAGLKFTTDAGNVEEIDTLMETQQWENMLREIMMARFWGVTLLEFEFEPLFVAHNIPRTHIKPEKGIIIKDENDETGVEYRNDPFFLEVKAAQSNGRDSFGLILKACPYVIYKRGNFGDWAQFAELFGMPFRVGKYANHDDKTRMLLDQALTEAGSAAHVVIPEEGNIEFHDSKSTGDGALYKLLKEACNEEILIGVLGQKMTTISGEKGARSLGEVQEGIHDDDRRFITRILNSEILPRLAARGYKVNGGKWAFPEKGETISLKDRISIDKELDKLIEIDAEYFYETYGIPVPKAGPAKKAAQEPETRNPKPGPEASGRNPKPGTTEPITRNSEPGTRNPKKWERLLSFFAQAPKLAGANKSTSFTTLKIDEQAASVPELVEAALKNIYEELVDVNRQIEPNLLKIVLDKLFSGVDEGFNLPDDVETDFRWQLKNSAAVFACFKTYQDQQAVFEQLFDDDGELKSYSQFKKDAEAIIGKSAKYLETEYDTAVLRARNAARWKEFERDADLFPNLKWEPSTSVEKRAYHVLLYGLVLPITDTFWDEHYPGDLWNCKCGITNTDEEAWKEIPAIDGGMKPQAGLDSNPGKTGELFTRTHPYADVKKRVVKMVEKTAAAETKKRREKK